MAYETDAETSLAGGHRLMPASRKPHCALCKEGTTPDKRLCSCAECKRRYHPGCYGRTLPGHPIDAPNWTCRRCLEKTRRGAVKYMRTKPREHDSSSYGTTAQSFTPARSEDRTTNMTSFSGSSFTTISNGVGMPDTECSVPRCSGKLLPNEHFCVVHLKEHLDEIQASKSSQTNQARLLPEHGPDSILPIARRKTGTTGGYGMAAYSRPSLNSLYHKPKTNGSSTAAEKSTLGHARSPPDSLDEAGPARKKARLDMSPAAGSEVKGALPIKSTNPEGKIVKLRDYASGLKHLSDTGGTNTSKRLSATNTQRKFAPRVDLGPRSPSVPGTERGDRSVSDFPLANGSAARGPSLSTASPQREGRDLAGNNSVRAWFSQRGPVKSEQPRERSSLGDIKNPLIPPKSSFEQPVLARSTSSVSNEMRPTHEDHHWPLPPSLIREASTNGNSGLFSQPKDLLSSRQPGSLPSSEESRSHHASGQNKAERSVRAKPVSAVDFDSLLYGQAGAGPPPNGVTINSRKLTKPPPPPEAEQPDEPFYGHIDPRLHWPQVHTTAWFDKKMAEIKGRGTRKENFGKVVQRMRTKRLEEEKKRPKPAKPVSWEDTIPEKIRENPAWLRAYKELMDELPQEEPPPKRKVGRPPKKRFQGRVSMAGPSTPKKGER